MTAIRNDGTVHSLPPTPVPAAGPVAVEPIELAPPIGADLDPLWAAIAPYVRTRGNDVHLPMTVSFAERLCDAHPAANADVVRVAALLHDTGWARVDERRIFSEGFAGDNWKQSDIRVEHEVQGCLIAREVLPPLGYSPGFVDSVVAIIDGHDTRQDAHSLEDALLRDADRLWRCTPIGIAVACGWFGTTPGGYAHLVETDTMPELLTEAAATIGAAELERTKVLFKLDVLS